MYFRLKIYLNVLVISSDEIGWKIKEKMMLEYDAVWVMQPSLIALELNIFKKQSKNS